MNTITITDDEFTAKLERLLLCMEAQRAWDEMKKRAGQ